MHIPADVLSVRASMMVKLCVGSRGRPCERCKKSAIKGLRESLMFDSPVSWHSVYWRAALCDERILGGLDWMWVGAFVGKGGVEFLGLMGGQ